MTDVTSNPVPAFDSAARSYDADFTEIEVGRLQRTQVHAFLAEKILDGSPVRVLELNCGTGADAIWMAGQGADVLATDLSGEMVSEGKNKWEVQQRANEVKGQNSAATQRGAIEFKQMDLRAVLELEEKFDIVFSNFGGLNCISPEEFEEFLSQLPSLLRSEGHFIGVIMPPFCAWETLYFLAKFRFRAAFRRLRKGPLPAPLGQGVFQDTYYYGPRYVRCLLPTGKTKIDIRPIGFFLPPSYLDPFFKKRHRWLKRLDKWEHTIQQRSSFASWSDHFLIAVQFSKNFPQ